MSYEPKEIDLGHPDSAIRLASAVHRFRVPQMTRTVSFARAFATTGGPHPKTKAVMTKADGSRSKLKEALEASVISGERIYVEATRYMPLISQILLTCKVQPEVARLDERLVFEWTSGMESINSNVNNNKKNKSGGGGTLKSYSSEALMYDVVMCCVSQALAKAATATEASIAGEFAQAAREYCAAAGMFEFLAKDHLPKWIAKGSDSSNSTDAANLPMEATVGVSTALVDLCLGHAQQMAVATVLIKPGTPNYSLLAKLCRGIYERLDQFLKHLRSDAFELMDRMDKEFFTLLTFQTNLQLALTHYFQGRAKWETRDYGLAIALLNEARKALETRSHNAAAGMPEITKGSPLKALENDLVDLRAHVKLLLKSWEEDNSSIFFERVPQIVPEDAKCMTPLQLSKATPYSIPSVDPLPLSLPETEIKRSDSDLARRLQEQLNAGLE